MSAKEVGEIDIHPWIVVRVVSGSISHQVRFLVDTGFDGEIAFPQSYAPWFGTSAGEVETEFANSHRTASAVKECQIDWLGQLRDITAIYIDGKNPLLGMDLLNDCVVTLEIENRRGDIVVEEIR